MSEANSNDPHPEQKAVLAVDSPESELGALLSVPRNFTYQTSFPIPSSTPVAESPGFIVGGDHVVPCRPVKAAAAAVSPYLNAQAAAFEAHVRKLLASNRGKVPSSDEEEEEGEDQPPPNGETTPISESLPENRSWSSDIDPENEANECHVATGADGSSFDQDVEETVEIEYHECASNVNGLVDSSSARVVNLVELRKEMDDKGYYLSDYILYRNYQLGIGMDSSENVVHVSCKELYSVWDNFNVSQLLQICEANSECRKIDLRNPIFVCGTNEIQVTAIQDVEKFFAGFAKLEELILAGPKWQTTDVTLGGFELRFPAVKHLVMSMVPHFPNGFQRICIESPEIVCLMVEDYSWRFSKSELLVGISSFLPRLAELTLCLEANNKFLVGLSSSFSEEKYPRSVEQSETMFSVGQNASFTFDDFAVCHILRACKQLKLLIAYDGEITTAGLKAAAIEGKSLEVLGLFHCDLSTSAIYGLASIAFRRPEVLFLLDFSKYNERARSAVRDGVKWLAMKGRIPNEKAHADDLRQLLNVQYEAWKEKFWSLQFLANQSTVEDLFWNIRKPNACAFVLASTEN